MDKQAIEEAQLKAEMEELSKKAAEDKKIADAEKKKIEEEKRLREEKKAVLDAKYTKAKDLFYNGKNYIGTINLAEEIIKEDSLNYEAYSLKGIALCYLSSSSGNANKYEEGMAAIEKSLSIKADYAQARFNKALALELFGHYTESLEWYRKALEIEDDLWSYYGIASIYGRKGDVKNAIENLKIAIEKNPTVREIAAHEEDFNNIKNSKEFKDLISNKQVNVKGDNIWWR